VSTQTWIVVRRHDSAKAGVGEVVGVDLSEDEAREMRAGFSPRAYMYLYDAVQGTSSGPWREGPFIGQRVRFRLASAEPFDPEAEYSELQQALGAFDGVFGLGDG
jgi:hypothetical protein